LEEFVVVEQFFWSKTKEIAASHAIAFASFGKFHIPTGLAFSAMQDLWFNFSR
jgi:hypothetical protein